MRASRHANGNTLYMTSTLALRPDDGKLAWYFQHIPGESLDLDETARSCSGARLLGTGLVCFHLELNEFQYPLLITGLIGPIE